MSTPEGDFLKRQRRRTYTKEERRKFKGIFVVNVKRNVDYNKLRTTAPKRGLLITGILPDPELGVAVFEWAATPLFFLYYKTRERGVLQTKIPKEGRMRGLCTWGGRHRNKGRVGHWSRYRKALCGHAFEHAWALVGA